MKNRKRIITTLIGMTLTAQLSPVAYTVVNAQEPTAQGQAQQGQDQQKTGLSDTKILLGGNGCWETSDPKDPKKAGMHQVEISFNNKDPKNMKLKTRVISGYEGTAVHSFHEWYPGEYIVVRLISGKTGKIKTHVAMSGKDNIQKLTSVLNNAEFEYGDCLEIYHGEGMQRALITGEVFKQDGSILKNYSTTGISTDTLNKYQFKIMEKGLVQVEQKIKEINSADKLIDELIALKRCPHQETIKLTNDIILDDTLVNRLAQLSDKDELTIPEGVTLIGGNSSKVVSIDLGHKASLVLKGNYTRLENINIKNSNKDGVQIYDSSYSSLKNVFVTGSTGYGIHSNGSNVAIQDCTTKNNERGGILISSSLDLALRKSKSSNVTFKTNTNNFNEINKVLVKDLQLINKKDGSIIRKIGKNNFKVEYGKMGMDKGIDKYVPEHQCTNIPPLSESYKDILQKNKVDVNNTKIEEDFKYYNI